MFTPGVSGSGSQVTLTVRVNNTGAAAAKGVTVLFKNGSTTLGTSKAVPVGAGGFATLKVTTAKLARGSQVVTAIVDPADTVAESNEANNKSQTTVRT